MNRIILYSIILQLTEFSFLSILVNLICNAAYKNPFVRVCFLMVPSPRIELGAEHYHCSILPLNYDGVMLFYNTEKSSIMQDFYIKIPLIERYGNHC